MDMTERAAAEFVMKTLREAGFEAFLVGGCVRDLVLGREPHDYDVTTNARPEQVTPLFDRTTPVGAAFGVVVVLVENVQIQVATYRSDGDYSDCRRPDTVSYSTDAREDVLRRDFTMNGLLISNIGLPLLHDSIEATVVDYVGGEADIEARVIRCIGHPFERFAEDALRMLRAVRFAAQLGFTIEERTYFAIVENVDLIKKVSRERIREELEKLVASPYPNKGLVPMVESGLFDAIFDGYEYAHELRFGRTLQRFRHFPAVGNPKFGIAMLFADCSNNEVDAALKSLKFSTEDYVEITGALKGNAYVLHHHFGSSEADVKLLARVPGILKYGVDLFEQSTHLFFKDYTGEEVDAHLSRFRNLTPEDINPTPLVTGDDLIAMGLTPSPLFKVLLNQVEYLQLNGQFFNAEEALQFVREEVARNASGKLPLLLL